MKNNNFLLEEMDRTKNNFSNLYRELLKQGNNYSQKYTKDDVRCGFFITSFENILWLMITFESYVNLLKDKKILDKLIECGEYEYQQYLISHNNITRMSYLAKFMFNVENFMKCVLLKSNKSTTGGYYELSKSSLQSINYYNDSRHKILNLPAQIRNSLHDGGIAKYPIDVTIDNVHYKANTGERINFADWDKIFISINALFDLIKESCIHLESESFIPSNYVKLWKNDPSS